MKRKYNVLGTDYKVKIKKMKDLGACCTDKKEITLQRGLRTDIKWEVLLHEFAHAFWYESGAYLEMGDFAEHMLTEMIANSFYRVFLKEHINP